MLMSWPLLSQLLFYFQRQANALSSCSQSSTEDTWITSNMFLFIKSEEVYLLTNSCCMLLNLGLDYSTGFNFKHFATQVSPTWLTEKKRGKCKLFTKSFYSKCLQCHPYLQLPLSLLSHNLKVQSEKD